MFTQFLGTAATLYGVLAAVKSLLQARQMLAGRSARQGSAGFLASYAGGYGIWLAYGLTTGSLPLIVVDTVGVLCSGLTLAVAVSLRGAGRPGHAAGPAVSSSAALSLAKSSHGVTPGQAAGNGNRTTVSCHAPRR